MIAQARGNLNRLNQRLNISVTHKSRGGVISNVGHSWLGLFLVNGYIIVAVINCLANLNNNLHDFF